MLASSKSILNFHGIDITMSLEKVYGGLVFLTHCDSSRTDLVGEVVIGNAPQLTLQSDSALSGSVSSSSSWV